MSSIFPFIWLIIIIVVAVKATQKKKAEENASAPSGSAGPQTGPRTQASPRTQTAPRAQAAPVPRTYGGSCETNRPQQLTNEQIRALNIAEYSHCSDISFRGLPEGADELAVLIRHNRAHEKELERHMHSTQSEEYDLS